MLTRETSEGPRTAIAVGDRLFDAAALTGNAKHADMLALLADWPEADERLAAFTPDAASLDAGSLADAKLLPPILYPGQIWAAGANYSEHIDEMGESEFKAVNAKTIEGGRPWVFPKTSRSAIVGHGTTNPLPSWSKAVDWEIELAVVIGRKASGVKAADAMNYVAGYTIVNDLSARDFVARPNIAPDSPFRYDWLAAKGFDHSCPMGPWIVPSRYIPDPHNLGLKLWVNDDLKQNSTTSYMIFDIGEQIEEVSARVTLHPGDVIMTGTPSGVAMMTGNFLKPGDRIRMWIEGIGELEHGFTPAG
ncbi:fumarylacetoacetate hydrolase family protein [Sphingobium sp.]|uniref:fumarylacetoacetate hydrolase family protein n=1 Tax=Sphingobium sp. TaxID=1912891 RepID=UPI0028BE2536|nr:fumarylacetoacetate hydrolase family protein [Sphingobium sp.]